MVKYFVYQVEDELFNYYSNLLDFKGYENLIDEIVFNKLRICIYWKNGAKLKFEGFVPGFAVCRVILICKNSVAMCYNGRVYDHELKKIMEKAKLM